jgi:hypothetical protein
VAALADAGLDDCGGSIDLLLDSAQVAALVFAAAGMSVKARCDRSPLVSWRTESGAVPVADFDIHY